MGQNISVTDLSVYQSALTHIGQQLNAKASNINQQTVDGRQTIKFINGNSNPCLERGKVRNEGLESCRDDCKEVAKFFGLSASEQMNYYNECVSECNESAYTNFPDCTPDQEAATKAQILGCDIEISQNAKQSIGATQISDAQVDSEMTASIMNTFENEVEKIISQTNEDINFMQTNSSHERTQVSQQVRSEISNAIDSISSNVNTSYANNEQFVEFTNAGIISCCGNVPCNPDTTDCAKLAKFSNTITDGEFTEGYSTQGRACGKINISQDMVQELKTDQTATSVLKSVFNSAVVNDLYNKYKYDLTQKNKGVDPWGFMYALAIIIGIIVLGSFLVGYRLIGMVTKLLTSPTFWIGSIVVVVVIVSIVLTVGLTNSSDNQTYTATSNLMINTPNSGAVKQITINDGKTGSGYTPSVGGDMISSSVEYSTTGGSGTGLTVYYNGFGFVVQNGGSGYKVDEIVIVPHDEGDNAELKIIGIQG